MDSFWRHDAADIQIPAPVGSKQKMENWRENSGDAKIRYKEARYVVVASQGRVSENMEQLTRQGSSVEKNRP